MTIKVNIPEKNDIDISSFSTTKLLDFMSRIVIELQKREDEPKFTKPAEQTSLVFSPPDKDVVFIKNCLSAETIKASMKDKWRELYLKHKEWFEFHGYPSSLRGSSFKEWETYFSPRRGK